MKKLTTQQLIEKTGLTAEQWERFARAAKATHSAIAADLGRMKQMDVIEVVLDADYIRMYGEPYRRHAGYDFPTFYKDVVFPMLAQHYHERWFKDLMRTVFPFATYE